MPDKETRCPENWYRRSGFPDASEAGSWYSGSSDVVIPRSAEAGCSTHQPPPRSAGFSGSDSRKRRRTKILSLSVSACVVVAAMIVAALQIAGAFQKNSPDGSADSGFPAISVLPGDETEPYADFREYFDNYYTTSVEVALPQAPTVPGLSLTLEPQTGEELTLQQIYRQVSPAVVGITTYYEGVEYSWGTGVVFSPDGYLITNTHVLHGDSATVTFPDGTSYEAFLVGADELSDIAVLHIDGEDLPWAVFGDSDALQVGDPAIAIGNPLGETYSGTMTDGIISAINRNISYEGHTMTLLQTNAALNEGNSGGPLINACGQVVGITNMKIMSTYYAAVEGIGFAIPSRIVKQIADQLIETGAVPGQPTIGIVAGSVSAEAMALYGLPDGVYVSEVNDGSDAKEQGMQVGDIILEVNGTRVTTVAEVNAIKEGFGVGDTLTLTIYREGETFEMVIALVDRTDIY